MSLEKYHNMYLECIKCFINKKSDKPDHKIYEYLYALELGLINWDDLPPDFDEQFNIPHKMDYGVDLVDLDYTKSCQVKKYENTTITWSHLCKFKTYSSDILDIENGNIILATTKSAKIDKLGQQKLIDSGKIILIRNEFDDLIEKYSKIKPKKQDNKQVKQIEKRSYLLECHNAIISSNNTKIKCQLPCGCGKSFIMLYTIQQELEKNDKLKFIIFIPWLDLARQTLNLYEQFNIKCEFIGNGKTKLDNNDYNVIICINPSVIHIDKKINFKYKFIDEAHHLENDESKNKKKIDKIKSDKEIHFSATYHKTDDLDFDYPLRKAINEKWISDYVLHFTFFNEGDRMDAMVNMLKGKTEYFPMFVYFNSTDRCKTFYEKLKESGISSNYLDGNSSDTKRISVKNRLCSGKLDVLSLCGVYNEGISIDNIRTVMFGDLRHSDINKVQIMMRASRLHHSKPFYRVIIPTNDDDMDSNDMKEIVRTFCKIDTKMKECIERKSKTRIKIDGINIEDVEKAELQYEQIYDRLGKFISGKSNEEIWLLKYDILKEYIKKFNKLPLVRTKFKGINIGSWCDENRLKYRKNNISQVRIDKLNKITHWFWNKYDEQWNINYELLINYIKEYNKLPIQKTKYKNISLGIWISIQKRNYKNNTLGENKIVKLQQIPLWMWDKYQEQWNNKYNLLIDYIKINNTIPQKLIKYKNENLGYWILTQKQYYKKNKLSKVQVKKLEDINGWYWESNKDKKWNEMIKLLNNYVKKYKNIPTGKCIYNSIKLGVWCDSQRTYYKKNKLPEERIEKLKKIDGWYWEFKSDDNWNNLYDLLTQYVNKNKKLPLQKTIYSEKNISNWVNTQKQFYKNNKLPKERIEKLEQIDGWYWKFDLEDKWNDLYDLLTQYVNKNKKLPLQTTIYKTYKIGNWINKQRYNYLKNKLSNERINKLEQIDGWYWKFDLEDKWNNYYDLLTQYVNENKKLPLQKMIYSGNNIGYWCSNQRQFYKNKKLSGERIEKLEQIDGWYWDK